MTTAHHPLQAWHTALLDGLNRRFEDAPAQEIVAWALETLGDGLSISTAFGASGMVLIHMALSLDPYVDIFYIDTGYFFPETYALIHRAQAFFGRKFRRVSPQLSVVEQAHHFGPDLHQRDPDLCCHLRKVVPLDRALAGRTGWMAALRRDQAPTRANTPVLRWDTRHNLVKIAPLVRWTETDVWRYIHAHGLPYNELHDRGYPSIGCWPCTRAVQPGEDLRAGRWPGRAKTECGLHWSQEEQVP